MSGWTAWTAAAVAALEAYEADRGEKLSDDHELGRIDESRGSPSFRIRVGHIRQLAAAPDLAEAAEAAALAIGDWSRPTSANGMTMPSPNHPLLVAAEKLRAALLKAKGE